MLESAAVVPLGPDPWIGQSLGKYHLLSRLGQGGMGVVYEAQDTLFRRRVAVKLLPQVMSMENELLHRFLIEARGASRLQHPNLVATLDVDQRDGVYYIVMELVQGHSAQDFLRQRGPFPWPVAAWIVYQVCHGLKTAHAAGLIHRDIKPSNILLSHNGSVKLADFGLAKVSGQTSAVTETGNVLGTPHYMSPEQCRAETVDDGSDVYSLAATFYALLTGKPPYPLDIPVQVMFAHCSRPAPNPHDSNSAVPESCTAIVRRGMAKRRDERYPAVREMLADLETILLPEAATKTPAHISRLLALLGSQASVEAHESKVLQTTPVIWRSPPQPETPRPPRRMKRWLILGSCLALLLLLLLLLLGRSKPDTDTAENKHYKAWRQLAARADTALQGGDRDALRSVLHDLLSFHETLLRDESAPGAVIGEVARRVDALRCTLLFPSGDRSAGVPLQAEARVRALACSSDLRWLAAAYSDGEGGIALWDFATHRPAFTLWGKKSCDVQSIAFSPDGKTLAAGCGNGQVKFWFSDGQPERTVSVGTDADKVTSLAFSADGKQLATLSTPKKTDMSWRAVRVWNWAEWRASYELPFTKEGTYALTFAPTGERVFATGVANGVVRVWDQDTGRLQCELTGDLSSLMNVVFAPDGKTLLVHGYERRKEGYQRGHQYWDLRTRTPVEPRFTPTEYHHCLAFSPDNVTVATGGSQVTLWDRLERKVIARYGEAKPEEAITALVFSPGGGILATASRERGVRLWDVSKRPSAR
jgi:serine/threonine protein kinase/WD40 repeat protein